MRHSFAAHGSTLRCELFRQLACSSYVSHWHHPWRTITNLRCGETLADCFAKIALLKSYCAVLLIAVYGAHFAFCRT